MPTLPPKKASHAPFLRKAYTSPPAHRHRSDSSEPSTTCHGLPTLLFPSHTPSAGRCLFPARSGRSEPSPGRPAGPLLPGRGDSLASLLPSAVLPHTPLPEAGGTSGAGPGPRGPPRPAAARPPQPLSRAGAGPAWRTALRRPRAPGQPLGTCAGLGAPARPGRPARRRPAASWQPPRPAALGGGARGTTGPSAHCGPAPPSSGRGLLRGCEFGKTPPDSD